MSATQAPQPQALQPVAATSVETLAPRELNCVDNILSKVVSWVRGPEDRNVFLKYTLYFLAFIAQVVLCATIIGIPLVAALNREWNIQGEQARINPALKKLVGDQEKLLTETIAQAQGTIAQQQQQLQILWQQAQQQLQQANQRIQQIHGQLQQEQAKGGQNTQQINRLTLALNQANQTAQKTMEYSKGLETQFNTLRGTTTALATELNRQLDKGEFAKLTKEMNNLRAEFRAVNNELISKDAAIEQFEARIKGQEAAYTRARTKIETLEGELKGAHAQIEKLAADLKQAEADKAKLQQLGLNLTEKLTKAEDTIKQKDRGIDQLKEMLTAQVDKYHEAEAQIEGLKVNIANLRQLRLGQAAAIEKLENELVTAKAVNGMLQNTNKTVEQNLTLSENKVVRLEQEIRTQTEALEKTDQQLKDKTAQLRNQAQAIEQLNGTITQQKARLSELTNQVQQVRGQLENTQNQLRNLQTDKNLADQTIIRLRTAAIETKRSTDQEITRLHTAMSAAKAEADAIIGDQQTRLETLVNETHQLSGQLQNVRAELRNAKGRADEAEQKVKELNQVLLKANQSIQQLARLGQQLETAKAEAQKANAQVNELTEQVVVLKRQQQNSADQAGKLQEIINEKVQEATKHLQTENERLRTGKKELEKLVGTTGEELKAAKETYQQGLVQQRDLLEKAYARQAEDNANLRNAAATYDRKKTAFANELKNLKEEIVTLKQELAQAKRNNT